jgi:hypothetical protein
MNIGHHWTFDAYLRKALRSDGLSYTFINPNADLAASEDNITNSDNQCYVSASDQNFTQEAIARIIKDVRAKNHSKVLILIPWVLQFSLNELNEFEAIEEFATTSYAGLTIFTPAYLRGERESDYRYEYEEFFATKPRHILWVGELPELDYKSNANLRSMPDFAETESSETANPIYDLSFFGQLSSYRGLFEILVIALFNPNLKVRIKGYGFSKHRIFRPWKYHWLRYQSWRSNPLAGIVFSLLSLPLNAIRLMPNLHFSKLPFESESELDRGMSETRVMFYCPKLPHGSGLTNKSLAAGIPILWNGLEGQAFRVLNENYRSGYFRYWHIFVPNKIHKQVRNLPKIKPNQNQMWTNFKNEIVQVKSFIE